MGLEGFHTTVASSLLHQKKKKKQYEQFSDVTITLYDMYGGRDDEG